MSRLVFTPVFALALAAAAGAPARAQFATTVIEFVPGANANPAFPAANALGGPLGGGLSSGSANVCVLGVGGHITLGFAAPIGNGPGADFLCAENALTFGGGAFTEVAAVEVSSDGVHFARFPTHYAGPPAVQPPFGTLPMGTFLGLTGGLPVLANVATNSIDPRDPAAAGGEAFDLADLASDPLVTTGMLDLASITAVRLVDVPEGQVLDSAGQPIFDNGGPTGSADIDAVTVVHAPGANVHAPVVDLFLDGAGHLVLDLGDPDGAGDLVGASLRTSFNLAPADVATVLSAFQILSFDGKVARLRTPFPLAGSGILGAFGVSIRDAAATLSGDQLMVQG